MIGVVVSVNSNMIARDNFHHLADDLFDLVRKRASVRITQDNPAGSFVISCLGAGERVFRVGLVAVEEMLAVEQNFPALRLGSPNAVSNRSEIFLLRRLQR